MSSRDKETASAVLAKPKTAKGARIQKNRDGKLHENAKRRMILRGGKTSSAVEALLSNLHNHFKPHVVNLHHKEKIDPLENPTSGDYIAHLSAKNDASLFVIGSKTKKRARKLLIGRCFDHSILDMIEFDALDENTNDLQSQLEEGRLGATEDEDLDDTPIDESTEPQQTRDTKTRRHSQHATGSAPLILFQGSLFDVDSELKMARNLLFDLFRGSNGHSINLQGIDHLLVFTAIKPGTSNSSSAESSTLYNFGSTNSNPSNTKAFIQMREYTVRLLRGEGQAPRVALEEVGTPTRFYIKKIRHPNTSSWKVAIRRTKDTSTTERNLDKVKAKKNKSIHTDELGRKFSKLHLEKQDLKKLHTPLR